MNSLTNNTTLFSHLGVSPEILTILDRLQFKNPTPIQHQAIPVSIEGKDVIGIAQTGTGKTLAFGLPLIQRLRQNPQARGLILIPTRELAIQVEEMLKKIGTPLGIHSAVLIGGESFGKQLGALRKKPRLIIATPGRLIDHLEQKTVRLDDVRILVLDEADRMLDMGFAPQINQILKQAPKERQTLLFSATMPDQIVHIAATYMKLPARVEVAPAGTASEKVEQEIIVVGKDEKNDQLEKILKEHPGTSLVFSRTKHGARKICQQLNRKGIRAAEIHSDRSQSQRREALDGFRRGRYRVLVATDIAARGIDVTHIELVINYDLPDNSEDYVHRIGRTGRAGREGKAISFATPDQQRDVRDIEKLIRKSLKIISDKPFFQEKSHAHSNRNRKPKRFQENQRQGHQQNRNHTRENHPRGDLSKDQQRNRHNNQHRDHQNNKNRDNFKGNHDQKLRHPAKPRRDQRDQYGQHAQKDRIETKERFGNQNENRSERNRPSNRPNKKFSQNRKFQKPARSGLKIF